MTTRVWVVCKKIFSQPKGISLKSRSRGALIPDNKLPRRSHESPGNYVTLVTSVVPSSSLTSSIFTFFLLLPHLCWGNRWVMLGLLLVAHLFVSNHVQPTTFLRSFSFPRHFTYTSRRMVGPLQQWHDCVLAFHTSSFFFLLSFFFYFVRPERLRRADEVNVTRGFGIWIQGVKCSFWGLLLDKRVDGSSANGVHFFLF